MSAGERLLPAWCEPAARIAAAAYGAVVRARNDRFDRGIGVQPIGVPVVSVGNIEVGGTGKSPIVRWIAERVLARGGVPLIALRGYGSHGGQSDEASEHQLLLPAARLAVGARRLDRIREVMAVDPSIGCVILDDGFQHRSIARDLDLVLVDARARALHGGLLPLGRLRESGASMARASAVIVTRAAAVDPQVTALIQSLHGRPPLAWCAHGWSELAVHGLDGCGRRQCESQPVGWLRGRRVAVWAGVGRPRDFAEQARECGAEVVHMARLRDHARYGRRQVAQLAVAARAEGAETVVMTLKDWVKVALDHSVVGLPVVVPRLEIRFIAGESELVGLVDDLLGGCLGSPCARR
ncbi:MAG: tetraacyldisaccharide 4'-kinase [Planctomycetes bacterium]|nr:tetraacyldisaccharide 4'-kinase [Planctomycetota bacterium]